MASTESIPASSQLDSKLRQSRETYERKLEKERDRFACLNQQYTDLRTQLSLMKDEMTRLQVLTKPDRPQLDRLDTLSRYFLNTSSNADARALEDQLGRLRREYRQEERTLLAELGLRPLIQPGDRVLVLTPGRVGTKSLAKSIRHSFPDVLSFDAHFFSQRMERALLDRTYFGYSGDEHRAGKLQRLAEARSFLHQALGGTTRFYVVTAIREPIDHAVALFFLFKQESLNRMSTEELAEFGSEPGLQALHAEFSHALPGFLEFQSAWYQDEFFTSLDLAPTTRVLPEGEPYKISRLEKFDLLAIRFENLDSSLGLATEEFFGQRAELLDKNMTSRKGFAALYKAFRDSLVISPKLADLAYDQEFARRSYSLQELDHFRKKWTGLSVQSCPEAAGSR